MFQDTYFSQFPNRFYPEEGNDDRHKKILQGNYAIVGRFVGSLFFPENNVSNSDLKVNEFFIYFSNLLLKKRK